MQYDELGLTAYELTFELTQVVHAQFQAASIRAEDPHVRTT